VAGRSTRSLDRRGEVRSLPISASDDDIRNLVVEWSELLAGEKYADALAMFPMDGSWTPSKLQKTIEGYGVPDLEPHELAEMLSEWGVDRFLVTTLLVGGGVPETIRKSIRVNRDKLYGLNPANYLGMVHYDDVPLSGYVSDLTARFHIKRINNQHFTLEFLDIHVM
jgi:hypothetical protein